MGPLSFSQETFNIQLPNAQCSARTVAADVRRRTKIKRLALRLLTSAATSLCVES
jgi:hypothetical protein